MICQLLELKLARIQPVTFCDIHASNQFGDTCQKKNTQKGGFTVTLKLFIETTLTFLIRWQLQIYRLGIEKLFPI